MSLLLLSVAAPAFACGFELPPSLLLEPSAADTVAPLAPELVDLGIIRGTHGGPFGRSSCDDLGRITLDLARPAGDTDDDETVGYRFELLDGAPPTGLSLPSRDDAPWIGPSFLLAWIDEAIDRQDAFVMTVGLIPVDVAGNEGTPLEVEIADDGGAGCSTAPAGAGWLMSLGLLPALLRRRTRQ